MENKEIKLLTKERLDQSLAMFDELHRLNEKLRNSIKLISIQHAKIKIIDAKARTIIASQFISNRQKILENYSKQHIECCIIVHEEITKMEKLIKP